MNISSFELFLLGLFYIIFWLLYRNFLQLRDLLNDCQFLRVHNSIFLVLWNLLCNQVIQWMNCSFFQLCIFLSHLNNFFGRDFSLALIICYRYTRFLCWLSRFITSKRKIFLNLLNLCTLWNIFDSLLRLLA